MKFKAYSEKKEMTVRVQFKSLKEAHFHNPTLINWKEIPESTCLNCGWDMDLEDLGDDDCKKTCYVCHRCISIERKF